MSIPRQVLAQAAEADAQLETMRNRGVTPPAPPVAEAPPEPPKPTAPPVVEDWKARHDVAAHRLSVTEGITRKQGEEIQALHAQVKQLKADLDAAKAPPAPAPDLSDYDPKLLATVDYLVDQRTAPVKRELDESRAERERRNAEEAKANEVQAKKIEFAAFMDEFVPGWREQDNEPSFGEYLKTVDPTTGQLREAAYMDALNRIDGRAMARVFKGYQKPTPQAPPPTPPVVPPVAGRVEVVDAPPGRIYTSAEIATYYDDALKGRLKARGWTQKRIDEAEQDIMAAYVEGRVRG